MTRKSITNLDFLSRSLVRAHLVYSEFSPLRTTKYAPKTWHTITGKLYITIQITIFILIPTILV